MLKIKNIKYGIIPTGPAIGVSAIQISFKEIEGSYEPDDFDTGKEKWVQNQQTRIITEHPRELLEGFIEVLKKEELLPQYEMATNAGQSCFIVYMGGEIDKPENFAEFNRFQTDLSNKAWNYQVYSGRKVNEMKPPYSIFVGVPSYMTGKNQFYESFNVTYPIINISDGENNNKFNTLALQECFNGPFSLATIFFENGNEKDIHDLKQKFKIPNHKMVLIDTPKNKTNIGDIVKEYNYRYSPYLTGKNFLKLI
jgi:hypothetical protein